MKNKIKVLLLTGGTSKEHQVSLISGYNILNSIDTDTYDVYVVGIHPNGIWHLYEPGTSYLNNPNNPSTVSLKNGTHVIIIPEPGGNIYSLEKHKVILRPDIALSVLHGKQGEDGNIQSLLNLSQIPYVGSQVLSSAITMDKDITKRILRDSNISVSKFITLYKNDVFDPNSIFNYLGDTVFVKPCNEGSSFGVTKVKDRNYSLLNNAISHAFEFDSKILIEEFIIGREIECAVLEKDGKIITSILGEIVPNHEFYSYEAKYIDPNGAHCLIAKNLDIKITEKIQKISHDAFRILNCKNLARVDFFLTKCNNIIINEINSLPGFTKISMYPQLWESSGIAYKDLISILINEALHKNGKF